MLVLHQFTTPPDRCEYLPDRRATLEYVQVAQITPAEYEMLMNRGWRKFGALLFRPVCQACSECRPIRIPVAEFHPDRSQRRALKANEGLEVCLAAPTLDDARMDLYCRYHATQAARKGWPDHDRDVDEYAFTFVHNPLPSVEITLWEGEALRAVVLTDVTPNVVSGIYHYYDPDLRDHSLGTLCMLQTIELARQLERTWAYFGFYVAGCGSLAYKARFRPCEILAPNGQWQPH